MSDAEAAYGRRTFLKLSGAAAIVSGFAPLASPVVLAGPATLAGPASSPRLRSDPTHVLRIRRARVELAPGHFVTTTTYDGQLPGPLLRATVGTRVLVDIHNETDTTERVCWHGQNGVAEEAPDIPAGCVRRMEFTPWRAGLHFYHSSRIAATCLDSGLYSGQVGAILVEPGPPSSGHEPEAVIVLQGCQPYLQRTARGYEVGYRSITVNGRLGAVQRIDVGACERPRVHVLNASATDTYSLELPGHTFEVIALDGNPVPSPARVATLCLSPGERVCARVETGTGSPELVVRIIHSPEHEAWDYTRFGVPSASPRAVDEVLELVLVRHAAARSGFNCWSLNGTRFSTSRPRPLFRLRRGLRYRLKISNTSDELIPIHLQHHLLQIVSVAGKRTAGVVKDVVAVGPRQQAEVELVADSPSPALLYCTRQLHRDFGLMAFVDYA
jgi:FtsP/CotA-like multicopper oxidase with cupredoxin domain